MENVNSENKVVEYEIITTKKYRQVVKVQFDEKYSDKLDETKITPSDIFFGEERSRRFFLRSLPRRIDAANKFLNCCASSNKFFVRSSPDGLKTFFSLIHFLLPLIAMGINMLSLIYYHHLH